MAEIAGKPQRRHDIDWLRVLVVLEIVVFHAIWLVVIFPGFSYSGKDQLSARILRAYFVFMHQWHIPLLFLLSGVSTCFALRFRSGAEYIKDRIKRLLVPLVFGILVILPPMFYYFPNSPLVSRRSYLHFLELFYNTGDLLFMHLWFIAYLFVYSIIALPLFLYLRKASGSSLTSKLAVFFERKGTIFLLGFAPAVIQATLRARWPYGHMNVYNDWANFLFYITIFIYGYIICSHERFWEAIERQVKTSLILGIVCMSLIYALRWTGKAPATWFGQSLTGSRTPGYMLYMALRGFTTWFWLLAALALGKKFLNFSNRALKYLNEAAYPIYILHQAAMFAIGHYLVKLRAPMIIEFLLLAIATFLASIAIYDLVAKRTNVTRFLFGMRLKRSTE
jgi:peptidoglycan/LPS O-acetylase OafA/YrhL